MAFICKKCKKAFRKDMSEYDESDEYCPHCDNHYVSARLSTPLLGGFRVETDVLCGPQVIDAKTPQAVLGVEGEDPRVDARCVCVHVFQALYHSI